MQINKLTPAVIAAATGLLQPFVPELSPQNLVAALRKFEAGSKCSAPDTPERPLTRQETAKLLSCCLNSVDRYANKGLLRRVKIGPRITRIDPASVRDLLYGNNFPEA